MTLVGWAFLLIITVLCSKIIFTKRLFVRVKRKTSVCMSVCVFMHTSIYRLAQRNRGTCVQVHFTSLGPSVLMYEIHPF